MSISILTALALIVIVIINFFLGFGKSNVMKKRYISISSILSIIGVVGVIIIRPILISRLNKGRLDADFISWAIEKFDYFATISIIATCIVILFSMGILLLNRKSSSKVHWTIFPILINIFRIGNYIFMFWYSFGTINKHFDLASYMLILSICQILALYIPLATQKFNTLND